jgi:hypothetical protein
MPNSPVRTHTAALVSFFGCDVGERIGEERK